MNDLDKIQNMMIELKDAVVSNDLVRIDNIEKTISVFLKENGDFNKLTPLEVSMVSRLAYAAKTVKINFNKEMAAFETEYEFA